MNNRTISTLLLAKNFFYNSLLSVLYPITPHPLLLPKPTYVSLFVGRNCPLHCQHCSFWKEKETHQLSFEQGKLIIDRLFSWLGPFRLNISGGEPLLTKDMLLIVTYAEKKGIRCGMASNGYLINENVTKSIIQSGLSNINISLDSLNPLKHDRIRGTKGAYAKAIRAIELIQKFRTDKRPLIYINAIISGENIQDLVPLATWVKDQHLDGINFQPIISDRTFGNTHAKKKWYKKNPLWPDKNINTILNLLQNLKQQGYPINNLESDEIQTLKTYFLHPELTLAQPCKIALRNFYIDHHGNITICQNYPPIGNIFKNLPEDIWKSKKAEEIRKRINVCRNDCQLLLCNRPHHRRRIIESFIKFLR
jgi:hypothetical protein